ncbi:MAG: glycosyltransferase family 39 protein [Candidatus Omnitrophica bacterium]|nr:glycosyltransferase family 39 protein [Candidatus Omnitrophota bacterium]MDD5552812.1 glycosyltransferase family 39 protein [Candidatus Omnitrophota bacterium]
MAEIAKKDNLLILLLGMAAILIFSYSWVPGGLDTDSCNYAAVAKEALRTNSWLGLYDPVYQGVFYYHFPLCIWITGFFFKILGVSTFAAKLFSMLSALALTAAIFYFGKLLKNQWTGFFAGAVFMLTNHIVRLSRQCRMDLPVTLFITLAILSFILAQRRSKKYYLLFGLSTSLAIFSKDISGLAPLAIVFVYLVLLGRFKEFFRPFFILGLLLAIGPVLLWIWLDKNTLFSRWWGWNFLHLMKSPGFNVPWHYYITAIINKYFYFLPLAVYGGYLAVKEAKRNKDHELYLLVIWALIFPAAFSFGRQKLHYFILPMYAATALLAGIALDHLLKEGLKTKIAAGIKFILIAASLALLCLPLNIRSKRFAETVRMSPAIDLLLRQLPEYDFIVYRQDSAAILFYSQELTRVKHIDTRERLEESLKADLLKPRILYIREEDFFELEPSLTRQCRVIFKYRDRMIIALPKELNITVILPDN